MDQIVQVVTTIDSNDAASRLAFVLVDRRLAACVQIEGPIRSTYRWNQAVESAEEWRLTIKTTRSGFAAIETAFAELHPYEVPELLATEVSHSSEAYRRWVAQQVGDEDV